MLNVQKESFTTNKYFSFFFFFFFFLLLLLLLFFNLADLPNHSFDAGGGGTTTCAAMVSHVGFTNTPKCTTEGTGDGDTTWKQMTNHVAASFGCCGAEKKSACWEDVSAGVCKTASDCTWEKILIFRIIIFFSPHSPLLFFSSSSSFFLYKAMDYDVILDIGTIPFPTLAFLAVSIKPLHLC